MKIGYARVSSGEQNLDLQRDALSAAGCSMIHEDEGASGAARRRPGLDQALATMKAGDALVTWRLDRLGRSLPHLIELVAALQAKGCEFVSLSEAIDSTSAGGKLIFHIMGALAEFERALIVERTRAGMASARARGRHLGRPIKLTGAQLRKAEEEIARSRKRFEHGDPVRRQPVYAVEGHARSSRSNRIGLGLPRHERQKVVDSFQTAFGGRLEYSGRFGSDCHVDRTRPTRDIRRHCRDRQLLQKPAIQFAKAGPLAKRRYLAIRGRHVL